MMPHASRNIVQSRSRPSCKGHSSRRRIRASASLLQCRLSRSRFHTLSLRACPASRWSGFHAPACAGVTGPRLRVPLRRIPAIRFQSLTRERKTKTAASLRLLFPVEVGDCFPLCVKAQLAASGFGSPARRPAAPALARRVPGGPPKKPASRFEFLTHLPRSSARA